MTKLRREKTQVNKITNEKGDMITNIDEIQRIIRYHFENLYPSKLENIHEMDKYLHAYNQSKLNQEDNKHFNGLITRNEVEAAITSFLRKKRPGPDGCMAEFYQNFEELMSILLQLFQEIERERTLPNSFY
jgi:hypothetical protein